PLLSEGGERRLNVAVTRAKNRITLVSSFSSHDMDPERSAAEGVKLLRQYLQYAETGGANLGDQVMDKPALNPFEVDVRDTLRRHAAPVTAPTPGRLPTAYQAAVSRTVPAAGQRTGPRPWIIPGQLIDAYSDTELIDLARWIRSDDALRTEDELLREMMRELG